MITEEQIAALPECVHAELRRENKYCAEQGYDVRIVDNWEYSERLGLGALYLVRNEAYFVIINYCVRHNDCNTRMVTPTDLGRFMMDDAAFSLIKDIVAWETARRKDLKCDPLGGGNEIK